MSVTIKDTDLPKVAPLAHIPRVRYTDADGRIHEGWYAFHVNRQLSPFESYPKARDCEHRIVRDNSADWNMPRGLGSARIVPDGGTIELLGAVDSDALLELADEIAEAGDGEYVNCDTRRIYRLMPAKANEWAERIRKAVGE